MVALHGGGHTTARTPVARSGGRSAAGESLALWLLGCRQAADLPGVGLVGRRREEAWDGPGRGRARCAAVDLLDNGMAVLPWMEYGVLRTTGRGLGW